MKALMYGFGAMTGSAHFAIVSGVWNVDTHFGFASS